VNDCVSSLRVAAPLRRYLRFGVVGATGVAVDMLALFILADPKMLALDLSLSKAIAAETAILNNFLWNERWTFSDLSAADTSSRGRARRFGRFNLICLAGIAFSVLLLNLQTRFLHGERLSRQFRGHLRGQPLEFRHEPPLRLEAVAQSRQLDT